MEKELKISAAYVTKKYEMTKKKSKKGQISLAKKTKSKKNFWALRGITFEVYAGEAIGLIGTNGSGKSTLSNIIAGTSMPTTGEITINGKTSIIAIKSGLKPELTGRENVRLKCLLFGMKNKEIDEIMESIIAFADLDDFIDQPLKNYSSGMKSRLGFAISIHQDPDILIIDEALSVGDDTFYQRCVEKIYNFKAQGKTIFYVSHSLKQIRNLCDKVLWIHEGEMKQFGDTEEVVESYKEYVEWYKQQPKKEQRAHKKSVKKARQNFDFDNYYQETMAQNPDFDKEKLKEIFYPSQVSMEMSISYRLAICAVIILLIVLGFAYMT